MKRVLLCLAIALNSSACTVTGGAGVGASEVIRLGNMLVSEADRCIKSSKPCGNKNKYENIERKKVKSMSNEELIEYVEEVK